MRMQIGGLQLLIYIDCRPVYATNAFVSPIRYVEQRAIE